MLFNITNVYNLLQKVKNRNKKNFFFKSFLYLDMLYFSLKQVSFITKNCQYRLIVFRDIKIQSFSVIAVR